MRKNQRPDPPATCVSCVHFYTLVGSGECRRFPPETILIPLPQGLVAGDARGGTPFQQAIAYRTVRSETPACGEHRPLET